MRTRRLRSTETSSQWVLPRPRWAVAVQAEYRIVDLGALAEPSPRPGEPGAARASQPADAAAGRAGPTGEHGGRAYAELRRSTRRQRGEMPTTTSAAGSTASRSASSAGSAMQGSASTPTTRCTASEASARRRVESRSPRHGSAFVPTSASREPAAKASHAPSSSAAQSCSPPPNGTNTPALFCSLVLALTSRATPVSLLGSRRARRDRLCIKTGRGIEGTRSTVALRRTTSRAGSNATNAAVRQGRQARAVRSVPRSLGPVVLIRKQTGDDELTRGSLARLGDHQRSSSRSSSDAERERHDRGSAGGAAALGQRRS